MLLDYADIIQLNVLANLESLNSVLIERGVSKEKRFGLLAETAISQYKKLSELLDEWILFTNKKDSLFYAKTILNNPEIHITNYLKLVGDLLANRSNDLQRVGLALLIKAKFSPQIIPDEIIKEFIAMTELEKKSERVNSFIKLVNDLRNNQKLDFKILQ